ncbi:MAG: IS256 family transposase [Myxococcales bacterium]|nr:IS256 family transposase [Myxococcales bacterium]
MKKSKRSLPLQATQLVIPTQEDFQRDLAARCRLAVQRTIQVALDEELERLVGAGPYERSDERVDVRNGAYGRRVVTTNGEVGVRVGRTRAGGAATAPLGRYLRRRPEIDDAITETYVRGASTRDMAPITQALLGKRVSRSTVSRVTRRLGDEVETLRKEPITEPVTYLYIDATFIDARWARTVENVSALVAYGVGPDGHRRLLAVHVGTQESEASWAGLLRELVERGLTGVGLVIADAHAGLLLAARKALPEARMQRCTVHLMRNVLAHVPTRHQKRLGRELVAVLHAVSLVDAKKALRSFRDRFARQFAEAVTCLESGFDAATQYFAFPEAHWLRVRTNNGLERLHGEIKRRTRAIGAFPDRASALRLITTVAQQSVSIWRDRIYLNMSLLDTHYAAAAA